MIKLIFAPAEVPAPVVTVLMSHQQSRSVLFALQMYLAITTTTMRPNAFIVDTGFAANVWLHTRRSKWRSFEYVRCHHVSHARIIVCVLVFCLSLTSHTESTCPPISYETRYQMCLKACANTGQVSLYAYGRTVSLTIIFCSLLHRLWRRKFGKSGYKWMVHTGAGGSVRWRVCIGADHAPSTTTHLATDGRLLNVKGPLPYTAPSKNASGLTMCGALLQRICMSHCTTHTQD